jgi:uncharacterized spore protein YtfJ
MSEWQKGLDAAERNQAGAMEKLDKLFAVAQPGAVYSEPIQAEGQTVITLNEVTVMVGYGFGIGEGGGTPNGEAKEAKAPMQGGSGGGGGGGGFSAGRPVAIVTLNANGVTIKPVVDMTKLAIAFLTTFGAMALMLARMNRMSRR